MANFINVNFEAAWESVRPVPMVHIDFGNGTQITRTLNGNVATYLTTSEGQVLDIVAGVYDPEGYKKRLEQLRLLANYVDHLGREKRTEALCGYHKTQLEAMKKAEPLPRLVNVALMTKARIEGGVKAILAKGVEEEKPATQAEAVKPEDTAFRYLKEDAKANETIRRQQVSELLSSRVLLRPEAIAKQVYKEILLVDLDDPYLGLGKTLFTDYPFGVEDRKAR